MNSSDSPDLQALFNWHTTADFADRVERLDVQAGGQLLRDRRWRSLTEALSLRDFAITLGFSECRLCPKEERFPDAEVRCGNKTLRIEITEVMTPGRTRDQEYKDELIKAKQRPEPKEEWALLGEAGANWVSWMLEGIEKKLKYDKKIKFDILVYNNISRLFELPEIERLSEEVGSLLNRFGFVEHWVWQVRSTTLDLLWPRLLRFQIPNWASRF